MRKTETTTTKATKWLNITLTKGSKRVQFGLPLDYFEKNGTPQQKKFIEAQSKKGAGTHELTGWNQVAQMNILGEVEDDDDDWS